MLTGFLVLYDDKSIGKIYGAAMLSLLFSVVYGYLQPYIDISTDRFATVMSAMIFLQLFFTLMLYAETYIHDEEIKAGWNREEMGLVMVVLSAHTLSDTHTHTHTSHTEPRVLSLSLERERETGF